MAESDRDPGDLLDSLLDRMQKGPTDRLDQQMREAGDIKAQEEAASQNRLEEMWVREHERQQAITTAKAEQKRQEQLLIRYALIGAGIIIAIIIIATLLLTGSGGSSGDPTPTLEGLLPLLTTFI